jgi:cytoplasmic iron level regulating protein YaaA (DUF328/UPF0246 family)
MNRIKKREWLAVDGGIQFNNLKNHYKEVFNDVVKEIKENQRNSQSNIKSSFYGSAIQDKNNE